MEFDILLVAEVAVPKTGRGPKLSTFRILQFALQAPPYPV